MEKRGFIILPLLAAGFIPQTTGAVTPDVFADRKDPKPSLFERDRLEHKYTLAGHRSHSGRSSHSSHRSSSGGGYSTRTALMSMQMDYGLKATGTITPQSLDALRIVVE